MEYSNECHTDEKLQKNSKASGEIFARILGFSCNMKFWAATEQWAK